VRKTRYETGDFDKIGIILYESYFTHKNTSHIILIVLNDCSWCEIPKIYVVHTVESLEMLYVLA